MTNQRQPTVPLDSADRAHIATTLDRAVGALVSLQNDDGHWCAELQGDSILASEYLLMKFILAQEREPMHTGSDPQMTLRKIARWMLMQQREDGTWGQYPGSKMDLSATVKAYFSLKLLGHNPSAAYMQRAREAVIAAGGAERCNSFSNFYLACLGQISWNAVPSIPPEISFLPRWSYFHMDKVSAWTRTMLLPLSIVQTLKRTRQVPVELGIDELFVDTRKRHRLTLDHREEFSQDGLVSWTSLFKTADRGLKVLEKVGGSPFRRRAMQNSLEWMLNRLGQDGPAATEGLGAIFPPMVYIQIALDALGYPRSHPLRQRAERELDAFLIHSDDHIRIQPCFSPIWDSGIALYALTDAGMTIQDDPVRSASNWLRDKQCDFVGDWIQNLRPESRPRYTRRHHKQQPNDKPAGWFFEYQNAWYPDVDDTAMVAMALRRAGGSDNIRAASCGVEWILDMQNDDGGWAAFDRTRDRPILEKIPFADHNALQDPSCPDITGRVLECLSVHGYSITHESVQRAVNYVKRRQEPEGCWFGRWGVNYIYGTWQAVIGPIRCGVPRGLPWIQKAGDWIKSIQMDDGSFGESADSYEDPLLKGFGPPTASQTAWAAMILFEIYGPDDPQLFRAIEWLCQTQMSDAQAADALFNVDGDRPGSWRELEFTGTGFPGVFYLRYHLYRLYFPLMAIARFADAHGIQWRAMVAESLGETQQSRDMIETVEV